MKSITYPKNIRLIKLLIAPPKISEIAIGRMINFFGKRINQKIKIKETMLAKPIKK